MDPIAMQAGRGQGFKEKKQFLQCEHCGMNGHTKENYYKIIGYPMDFKPKKKFRAGNLDGWRREPLEAVNNVEGSPSLQRARTSQGTSEYKGIVTCLMYEHTPNEWIIDSCATHHIAASLKMLQGYDDVGTSRNDKVYLPTGEVADITHVGDVNLFDKDVVQNDLYSGRVKGIGRERGGLYILKENSNADRIARIRAAAISNYSEEDNMWHMRDVVFKETIFPFKHKDSAKMVSPSDLPGHLYADEPLILMEIIFRSNFICGAKIRYSQHPFTEVEHEQGDVNEELRHEQGAGDEELEQNQDQVPTADTCILVIDERRKITREFKQLIWMNDYITHPPKAHSLYPISDYLSYANTSVKYQCYLAKFSSLVEPQTFKKAVKDTRWIEAIKQEIKALEENNTWEVVDLPTEKTTK
ncbi:uncharacterized protein LOC107766200 [Nicotiana tabacum]|uniref:Uncharacterized protein LOC107766200 n=1 Tax=Nicotiana tabacum TaxID=4097 RepID=A0AC58SMH4_TOBAC